MNVPASKMFVLDCDDIDDNVVYKYRFVGIHEDHAVLYFVQEFGLHIEYFNEHDVPVILIDADVKRVDPEAIPFYELSYKDKVKRGKWWLKYNKQTITEIPSVDPKEETL